MSDAGNEHILQGGRYDFNGAAGESGRFDSFTNGCCSLAGFCNDDTECAPKQARVHDPAYARECRDGARREVRVPRAPDSPASV